MGIQQTFETIKEGFNKIPTMGKVSLILAILLLISIFAFRTKVEEGFTNSTEFLLKEGPHIYDSFYASIYDTLVFDDVKNDYEIGGIINTTSPTEHSVILDIGSGTGHHVGALQKKGYNAYGLEISPDMIEEAKQYYPSAKFVNGDALDSMIVSPESVSHILCLNFTLYYIKDKTHFFQNCFKWLMPGGYLAIHLVNKERFDPILRVGNPLPLVAIQDYAKERLTDTRAKFDGFEYKGHFELLPNDMAQYKEVFINDKTGKVRQNNHVYYMEPQKKILEMARNAGFILSSQIELFNAGYDYQFVYVLQKPN